MGEYHTVISVVLWHSFHFPKLNWCLLKGIVQHVPVVLTADLEFLQGWCQHLQHGVVLEVQLCFLKQILSQYPQGVRGTHQLPMWSCNPANARSTRYNFWFRRTTMEPRSFFIKSTCDSDGCLELRITCL